MAFLVTASDLHPKNPGNIMLKYADDCDLLVPSSCGQTIQSELDHISTWASNNNLKLNQQKSYEMIVRRPRQRKDAFTMPTEHPGLTRVDEVTALGVTLSNTINFKAHIDRICKQARQSMYALRVLSAHGLGGVQLQDVTRATVVARLLYASPVWWGYADAESKSRLQATIRKLIRCRYLPGDFPPYADLCDTADDHLFSAVLTDRNHVLHQLLPPVQNVHYSLRPRAHNRTIPLADNLERTLYSECCIKILSK